MNDVIGADHEFHDKDFVAGWADRFEPTPDRLELFGVILSELKSRIPPRGCVVELGIGPGYLANHLLQAMPDIRYYGVDFSRAMLDIARQRLDPHSARVHYVQMVYRKCAQVLQHGGILLNRDFIKPDKTIYEYEPGRIEIEKHLELMRDVGLKNAECLVVLEEEIESPTAAQNYADFNLDSAVERPVCSS